MGDRPILFSAPMVRALLEGRKSQTRRVIKPQPPEGFNRMLGYIGVGCTKAVFADDDKGRFEARVRMQTGDRLYVREHWRTWASQDETAPRDLESRGLGRASIWYDATPNKRPSAGPLQSEVGRHRQAMHMPRWASRITLLVIDVKVDRLQAISEEDAIAEGCAPTDDGMFIIPGQFNADGSGHPRKAISAVSAYDSLWQMINGDEGPASWDANPWVVAYTFSVVMGNIDQIARAA